MTKVKLGLMLVVGGVLMASCSGDGDGTVSGLAFSQISNSTCNTTTPRDINGSNFSDDDTQLNIDNLNPGCTAPGG